MSQDPSLSPNKPGTDFLRVPGVCHSWVLGGLGWEVTEQSRKGFPAPIGQGTETTYSQVVLLGAIRTQGGFSDQSHPWEMCQNLPCHHLYFERAKVKVDRPDLSWSFLCHYPTVGIKDHLWNLGCLGALGNLDFDLARMRSSVGLSCMSASRSLGSPANSVPTSPEGTPLPTPGDPFSFLLSPVPPVPGVDGTGQEPNKLDR
jgi:hypothetical protein